MKNERTISRVASNLALVALAFVTLVLVLGAWARAADVPRYKLLVGQELTYRTPEAPKEAEPKPEAKPGGRKTPQFTEEFVIVVAGQNGDGSWRLVYRNNLNYGGHDRWNEGYFDMAADGRIVDLGTLAVMADPTLLFPPLPPDAAKVAGSWSASIPLDETRRDCKAAAAPRSGDVEWSFTEDHHTIFEPIYLFSEQRDYLFDLEKGLLRKVAKSSKQGWPAGFSDETHKQAIELVSSRQLDSAELAALSAETKRYFAARAEYDKIMAATDFAHMKEGLDQAEAKLKALDGQFQVTMVKEMLAHKLKGLADLHRYELENAERFGKLIGKPSDDWKTADLDGHPRSLEDYRGKVVLLDFWYRGCGWCIRAMPQFKQLVDDFSKDRFVVLGMNNDRNLDDARLVIEKMGLNYATLKNGDDDQGIHSKYGVQGWPTLVMLDGQGVIRHIHVGYSPTLRKVLGDKIRELLAEKPVAASQ